MWRLYKRGKIWWAYRTVRGEKERRSTGHSDKRLAEAVVLAWHRGEIDPASRSATVTLSQALAEFIDERRARGRADGTLSMHEQKAVNLLRILGANRTLDRLGAEEVDAYIAERLRERVRDTKAVARSTIGKELSTLRGALRLARRRGKYHLDHTAVMPIGWSDEYVPKTAHLTIEQTRKLLATLRPDRAAHVAFIVATGARWSESLRATRADVDAVNWQVKVHGTKTAKAAATVVVPPAGRDLLSTALARAPRKVGPLFDRWLSVRRDLAAACKRAGVPAVTPNDLRRTTSSWLVQAGVDLFAVSKVMRHADTRMVERVYGQVPSRNLRDLLERAMAPSNDAPATVTRLCLTGAIQGDARDVCHSGDEEETAENAVPRVGIEPTTRGFSSLRANAPRRRKTRCAVRGVRPAVTGLCLDRAPRVEPHVLAIGLAKACALDGDEPSTLAAMLDTARALGWAT